MADWNRTIRLTDLVKQYHAGQIGITELAEVVAVRIEESGWLADTPFPDTLRDHIDRMKQSSNPAEYEAAWEYLYDVADQDRVWIETQF